jgi:hypothetical protein
VGRGRQAIGVLLRDHFALFGDAYFPVQGAGSKRFQEYVRRPGPAANGAAAAVKEAQFDARLARHRGQPYLGLAQIPVAGQDAAILVTVAVTDHHFLDGVWQAGECSHGHGVRQEIGQHAAAVLQVLDGLEQRSDRDLADQPARSVAHQARLARQQVNVKQIGGFVGHAHDELAHPAAAVPFAPFPRQPQHGNARLRLRRKRRRGDRKRARRA